MAPGARLNHAAVPCLYSPVRTRALVLLPVLPRPAVSGSRSLSRALARFVCCGLVAHAPREPMALPPHPLASAPTRHPPQSSAFVRAHCPCRRRPWEQIEEGAIKRCARLLPAFCRALSLRRSLTPTRLMLVRLQGILEDDLTGHKFDNKEYMTYFTLVYNMYVGPHLSRTPRGQRDSQDLVRVAQVHAEAASQLLRATVPAVQEGDQRLSQQCSATSRAREDRPVHAEGGGETLVVRRFRASTRLLPSARLTVSERVGITKSTSSG